MGATVRYWYFGDPTQDPPEPSGSVKMTLHNGLYYVTDATSGHLTPAGLEAQLRSHTATDGLQIRVWVAQPPGKDRASLVVDLQRRLRTRILPDPQTTNKVDQVAQSAAIAESGRVRFLKGSWNADLLAALVSYPSSQDAQVFALAGALSKLTRTGVGFG